MQFFVKHSDAGQPCGALQWAANRAREAKRQKGGERWRITLKDGTAPAGGSDP